MKRKHTGGGNEARKKERQDIDWKDGAHESVLHVDILNKLKNLDIDNNTSETLSPSLPDRGQQITLKVEELSSTGDGLAYDPESASVYVVPYALPGDLIKAKIMRHAKSHGAQYVFSDLVEVLEPSADRDASLIRCKYFAKCAGCQFQMMPYTRQLEHKRRVVEKAYQNFSSIETEKLPKVGETIASPRQYGYRTKLTPHFDGPPGRRSDRRKGIINKFTEVPPIGFMSKNSRTTVDIEDCPIGTATVQLGMKRERQRVKDELETFRRGVTLLLRESTRREPRTTNGASPEDSDERLTSDAVREDFPDHTDYHTCITDQKGETTEYVDDFVFRNRAGAFFQNNNSILPVFTQYIREHALPPNGRSEDGRSKIKYLIDAYCGSGLFTVTLSSMFERSLGIDIDESSVAAARQNALANKLSEAQATFMAADAKELFAKVDFLPHQCVAVVDPPRKGCGVDFLRQLMRFGPARVVYVSCNVHTQAKDVDLLVNGIAGDAGHGEGTYEIESLRGFDFFPQTGHVESVAVLNRKAVPEQND